LTCPTRVFLFQRVLAPSSSPSHLQFSSPTHPHPVAHTWLFRVASFIGAHLILAYRSRGHPPLSSRLARPPPLTVSRHFSEPAAERPPSPANPHPLSPPPPSLIIAAIGRPHSSHIHLYIHHSGADDAPLLKLPVTGFSTGAAHCFLFCAHAFIFTLIASIIAHPVTAHLASASAYNLLWVLY
jgi:hypothetical protein